MRVTVVRPDDLGLAEIDLWRAWQSPESGLDNPFLSPEFTLAVARARHGCEVAVFEDGSGIAGFLPYERHGRGPSRALALGVADCQGVVHRPDVRISPLSLLELTGMAIWEFDHLLASQVPHTANAVLRMGSPVMDLTGGYEEYWSSRRAMTRSTIRAIERKSRKLSREHGTLRFEYDCRDPAILRQMMRWKSDHYRRTGAADRFSWPWVRQLVEDTFATRTANYGGLLSALYVEDRPIAITFGPCSRTVCASWFASHDQSFHNYSPGLIALMHVAKAAAAAGIRMIDLGKGNEPFKEHFATSHIPIAEGWFDRSSARALLYRAWRTPPRAARQFIKSRPVLRRHARELRDAFNRMRRYGFRARSPQEIDD